MKRPDLVVAGAVVLCLPMLPALLAGSMPTITALERFLIALIVSWVAGIIISAVYGRYSREARRAELLAQIRRVQGIDTPGAEQTDGSSLETARPDRIIPPS
ncbi:hypothetical protein K6U06_11760 [Acidiferrimicrobium sp. IK]|uniref:hypothetical protein n=1 Tax=Acidiferrimicrobium sp. IK TaxID=2871700 RepID=UPI0021CAEA81|nr:hypothetical protein [Acidiferrimicrobium sp. IK]MCU4185039.1 hypothetical protein [Acidiferrimicrobium sp. IK]